MLLNLHKKSWVDGLTLADYSEHCETNEKTIKEMLELAKNYNKVSPSQLERIGFEFDVPATVPHSLLPYR